MENKTQREICMSEDDICAYINSLVCEEKSVNTIKKYTRDLKKFLGFFTSKQSEKGEGAKSLRITQPELIAYKQHLAENYAPVSANSMLAPLNNLLKYLGHSNMCLKLFKVQRRIFLREERNLSRKEYDRLIEAAKRRGDERIALVMQTMASTGIRISELRFLTVESLREGRMTISSKGKLREVCLPAKLQKRLKEYIRKRHIESGSVFVTRNGKPLDRSNICRLMKALCDCARVLREKVFPHNLRHLFAREFYAREKDIVLLSDLLGHSSLETTRIYTMTDAREHLKKLESLNLVS